jgi:hypothetical protein
MAARLGRHAILLLARARAELLGTVGEPLVLDHFETFESTQDYQFGVATLVGSRSWFVYDLDPGAAPPHRQDHRGAEAAVGGAPQAADPRRISGVEPTRDRPGADAGAARSAGVPAR